MKAFFALITFFSVASFANSQLTDAQLIGAIKYAAAQMDFDPMAIEHSIPASELPPNSDVARDFDHESEFADVEKIALAGTFFYHYQDLLDGGNGCYKFYNAKGSYLDALCGSESSEWTWESDEN